MNERARAGLTTAQFACQAGWLLARWKEEKTGRAHPSSPVIKEVIGRVASLGPLRPRSTVNFGIINSFLSRVVFCFHASSSLTAKHETWCTFRVSTGV